MLELLPELREELEKLDNCLILKIIDYINNNKLDNNDIAFVCIVNSGLVFYNSINEALCDVVGISFPLFTINHKLKGKSILPEYLDNKVIFLIDDLFGTGYTFMNAMTELLTLRKPKDVVIVVGSLIGCRAKYIENYRSFEQHSLKLKTPHAMIIGKVRQISFFNNIQKLILNCTDQDELDEIRSALTIKS
jgi:uracil phosphoribosyltransferase